MDVFFRMADIYSDTLGVIDTVEYTETYLNAAGSNVYTAINLIPPT